MHFRRKLIKLQLGQVFSTRTVPALHVHLGTKRTAEINHDDGKF
jgi:hypothetical protein